MTSLVRAACLTNYREVAQACGLDPVRMLLDADLSPGVLDEPDLMIPVERVGRLLQASATVSGNERFGLCMARSRRLSNLGAVGLLMRDQHSLRDALKLLMRYQAFLNGALTLSVEENGNTVVIRELLMAGSTHQPTRQRVELALGVMVGVIRQLLGPDWQPRRVCFEHAAPRDLSVHTQLLGRHVEFDFEFNCIVCTRSDLDTRNAFADPAMVRYAQQLLDALLQPGEETMLDEVRRTMFLLLPGGRCSIENVSAHLGVLPRTLQRRLTQKNLSFSALLNELRKELASRYVMEGSRSLRDISELLGFTAPSSFSRWYALKFGASAKQSRQALAAQQRAP